MNNMEHPPSAGPLGAEIAVTHILVVTDPARSRDFWVDVLGAELYLAIRATRNAGSTPTITDYGPQVTFVLLLCAR
jgi:hypothetical protein